MKNSIITLLDSIAAQPERPQGLADYIEAATERQYPPPSVTWTLIAINAYRERKNWAWEIILPHLHADTGSAGDSDTELLVCTAKGIVAQQPEWKFSVFGGSSGVVQNRVTGENIFVTLRDGPNIIFWCEFPDWLSNNAVAATQRLTQLHPRVGAVWVATNALMDAGILEDYADVGFELCGDLYRYESVMQKVAAMCCDRNKRLWLAATIGDWPMALDAAKETGRAALAEMIAPLANECHAKWIRYLVSRADYEGLNGPILYSLADANCPALRSHIETALANDIGAALDIIETDPSWCSVVYENYDRTFYSKTECASYLARHGYRTEEVIDQLVQGDGSNLDKVLELAVRHAPELLPKHVPSALRSSDRDARLTAAAVLAVLDDDWSHSQLIGVLESSGEWDATSECRAALRESTDPAVRSVPDKWEERNVAPEGDSFSSDDSDRRCEQILWQRMDELFDSVMKVKRSLSTRAEQPIESGWERALARIWRPVASLFKQAARCLVSTDAKRA